MSFAFNLYVVCVYEEFNVHWLEVVTGGLVAMLWQTAAKDPWRMTRPPFLRAWILHTHGPQMRLVPERKKRGVKRLDVLKSWLTSPTV